MAVSVRYGDERSIEFSFGEFTGALGDSVTVLPIVVAVAALTSLSLAHLLLGFAVFQVVWGLYYGLPVSVEPMKALAALTIGGVLSVPELAAAGLLAGVGLLIVGTTGLIARVERHVGRPVVRGVQLAVALILLEAGIGFGLDGVGLAVAGVVLAAGVAALGYPRASALAVLALGAAIAVGRTGVPSPGLPGVALSVPTVAAVRSSATLEGTVAQLAMTVGNAAVATSLLLSDYYDADVSPDELTASMGAMNLLAVPLGAMPMCHGSGGVAGKYAFGARTAGSNLVLGALYAATAVLAVGIVAAFPMAILGVVLAAIALELGRASLATDHLPLTVGVGVVGLVTNVGLAFGLGVAGYALGRRTGVIVADSEDEPGAG